MGVVRSGMSGAIPPGLAGLLPPMGRLRTALFLTPAAVLLAVVGVVLAAAGLPAEPPKSDPPKTASPATGNAPPRTDLFGDPLPEGVILRLGTTRSRAGIHSFGLLANGTVVTVGPNLDVRTWSPNRDMPDAPVLLPLAEPDPYLYPQVSADGRFIAAGSPARVVVWERPAPAVKQVAAFDLKNPQRLALSSDGSQLAVAYEPQLRKPTRRPRRRPHQGRAGTAAGVGRSDTHILRGRSAVAGRLVEPGVLWDVPTGKLLADHKGAKPGSYPSALDRTGEVIAVVPYAWGKERVQFLDATTGKPVGGLCGPETNGERWVNFAPDGKSILLGSQNGVRWWDPAAGKLIRSFAAPAATAVGFVRPLGRFTTDGKVLVSTPDRHCSGGTRRPARRCSHRPTKPGTPKRSRPWACLRDGSRVATLGQETGLRVWDAATGRQLAVLPSRRMNQENLDFSANGNFLFAPDRNGASVVKWNLATGAVSSRYATGVDEPWGGGLRAFRLAPDGRTVHALTSYQT